MPVFGSGPFGAGVFGNEIIAAPVIPMVAKKFISKAIDFKNEGTKNKWVTDLLTELEAVVDSTNASAAVINAGTTTIVVIPKLSPSGSNGSMTFTNGVLTSQTPAT